MRIVCPDCQAAYDVSAQALGVNGRMVKCADCGHKWFQEPELEEQFEPLLKTTSDAAPASEQDPWAEVAAEEEAMRPAEASAEPSGRGADQAMVAPDGPSGPRLLPERRKSGSGKSTLAVSPPLAAFAALLILLTGAVIFRTSLVRLSPSLASLFAAIGLPVNTEGLALESLAPRIENDGSRQALIVSGTVRNLTRSERDVPELRLAILDINGRELAVLAAPPPQPRLGSAQSAAFTVRVAVPASGGERYELRFARPAKPIQPATH